MAPGLRRSTLEPSARTGLRASRSACVGFARLFVSHRIIFSASPQSQPIRITAAAVDEISSLRNATSELVLENRFTHKHQSQAQHHHQTDAATVAGEEDDDVRL